MLCRCFASRFKEGAFLRHMSIVMAGTAISQVIGFASLPILSRLYDAADFGVFGTFSSLLAIASVASTLQYSQAVMLPENDDDAAAVWGASLFCTCGVALICLVLCVIFHAPLLRVLSASSSTWMIWGLPVAVLFSGTTQSLQAWCVRRKRFGAIASFQVIRSLAVNLLQVPAGLLRIGGDGLVGGAVTADGISSAGLATHVFRIDRRLLCHAFKWRRISRSLREYRDFPLFSASQCAVNSIAQGMPVLMLSYYFDIKTAGAYAFGSRIMLVPFNFLLTAFRQTFFQKVCETHNQGGRIFPLFIKSTIALSACLLPLTFIFFALAPRFFVFAFGSEWGTSGQYARWLVVWLTVSACMAPATLCARLLRKQRQLLIFEVAFLLLTCASLYVGGTRLSANATVVLFTSVSAVTCSALIVWIAFSMHASRS